MAFYNLITAVAFWFFLPARMNAMYYNRTHKKILAAKAQFSDRVRQLASLQKDGGTNSTIKWVFAILILGGIVAAVALPAYQDYTRRAQVANGFEIGSEAATNVGNFYVAQQKGPSDLALAGFSLTPSSTVRDVAFESQTGVLTVSFHDDFFDAKSLLLVPKVSDGKITWLCTSTGISSAYLPPSCKVTQAEANASLAAIAASAQAEADANLAYKNALSLIEQQHPELNPDSTVFNSKAMDWVAARMRVLKESGQTPVNALQWAVGDYKVALRQNQSGQVNWQSQSNRPQAFPPKTGDFGSISASRQPVRESRSDCAFKEVMTDADYRACGLQPPQNKPTTTSTPSASNNYDVIDKGGHSGFPEKCRWVTPSEWSCK
jgi:type IV pilus assembly protein PilA